MFLARITPSKIKYIKMIFSNANDGASIIGVESGRH
jgi:hypothetical protein